MHSSPNHVWREVKQAAEVIKTAEILEHKVLAHKIRENTVKRVDKTTMQLSWDYNSLETSASHTEDMPRTFNQIIRIMVLT